MTGKPNTFAETRDITIEAKLDIFTVVEISKTWP
jgi:hypothetical protein